MKKIGKLFVWALVFSAGLGCGLLLNRRDTLPVATAQVPTPTPARIAGTEDTEPSRPHLQPGAAIVRGESGDTADTTRLFLLAGLREPAGTMQAALRIQDPVLRQLRLLQVYSSWLTRDRLSAAEWLATLPSSPERDALAIRGVEAGLYHDLRLSTVCALAISDPEARAQLLKQIRTYWDRDEGFELLMDADASSAVVITDSP